MPLRFRNKTTKNVQVAIEWHDPSCAGMHWRKKGWWHLAPGEQKTVFGPDLRSINPVFYFYAEAVDGSFFWAGPVVECLPYQAFDWCSDICNTSARNIGMREYIVPYNASAWNIGLIK